LIDLGRLSREPAEDDEVAGLWVNALQAFGDAKVAAVSPSGRLVRAYDAGRIAAMSLVRSRDLRVRATNHHEVTLTAARAIAGDELGQALSELDEFRARRANAEYGWRPTISVADAERAVQIVRRVLEEGARNLREHRPSLAHRIQFPAALRESAPERR
jgi:hypothetical protein